MTIGSKKIYMIVFTYIAYTPTREDDFQYITRSNKDVGMYVGASGNDAVAMCAAECAEGRRMPVLQEG